MKAILIIGDNVDLKKYDFSNSFVVGIDHGAALAIANNINLNVAIGDFDSTSPIELEELIRKKTNMKIYPVKKDITDTYAALELPEVKACEEILILGGITGNRIEHFYANLLLLNKYPNLIIIDDNTTIRVSKTREILNKTNNFYSFFALEDVTNLTLEGFKFPLIQYNLSKFDSIGISNEIELDKGIVTYDKGTLIIFKTKKNN